MANFNFNPRPREEGDCFIETPTDHEQCFNPRPREEGDKNLSVRVDVVNISIHALVKRATPQWQLGFCSLSDFNPRPREEGDIISGYASPFRFYFNPRPREEGDLSCRPRHRHTQIFQSTPS